MIDANIPLRAEAPEFDSPMKTIGALMQMRNMNAQLERSKSLALQEEAQAQKIQAETEQHNRDTADSNTVQEFMKNPEHAKAFGNGDFSVLAGKIQPGNLNKLVSATAEAHSKMATTHEKELENMAKHHALIADAITGLKGLENDAAIVQEAPAVFNRLKTEGVIPPDTQMPEVKTVKDLDRFLAQNAWLQGSIEGGLKTRKEKQALDIAAAAEARTAALAPGALTAQGLTNTKLGQETTGTAPLQEKDKATIEAQRATAQRLESTAAETRRHNVAMENKPRGGTAAGGGKPLPAPAIKDLDTRAQMRDSLDRFVSTFKDEYAGNRVTGGLESTVARMGGEALGLADKGVGQWWQDYQSYLNDIRHGLFGAALTQTEKEQFDKQTVNPRMDPSQIRENLSRQQKITRDALARKARVYQAGGYSPDQIAEYVPAEAAKDSGTAKATHRFNPKNGKIEEIK